MATNNAALYLRLNIAFSCLATLGVALRYIARYRSKIPYGPDDVFILIAWIFLLALNINGGILYMNGGADGTPLTDLSPGQLQTFFKCFYLSQIFYYLCMLPTKLSILALYRRVFTLRRFRIWIWIVVAICVAWFIGNIIPSIVQCQPIESVWNRNIPGACINMAMLFSAITISNLLTDVIILCLPMFVVSKLNLTPKSRIALCSIFLLGGTTCVCALVRVISQYHFGNDIMTLTIDCALWTIIEPALAVLAACLPTLRPLIPTSKISAFYSSFASSGAMSSSNAGSKKRHSFWLGGPGGFKSSSTSRHGTTVKSMGDDSGADDAYPLKGFDRYEESGVVHTHTISAPSPARHGMFGYGRDTSDSIEPYHGASQTSMNGIYVTKEVMVNEVSVLDR